MKNGPVLIFTAGFGEGHNSAAYNLQAAINKTGSAFVDDSYQESFPRINKQACKLYRKVTTATPKIWSRYYKSTDRQDYTRKRIPLLRRAERRVHRLIAEYRPSALVSTYPIYPYYFDRYTLTKKPKVYTIVTDSIVVNKSWVKAPTDYFLVSDEYTKSVLISQGIAEDKVKATGFPLSPAFETLTPLSVDAPVDEFKVLYFPVAKKPLVRRTLRALLENPDVKVKVKVTVVLGRNYKHLYKKTAEIKAQYPDQVEILGWVDNVPEMLHEHHVILGKAGGATVHEAIGAACPMLIHHIIPGQEEGNLQLLRHYKGGDLCNTQDSLKSMMTQLTQQDGLYWREMKKSLLSHRIANTAARTADFIRSQS